MKISSGWISALVLVLNVVCLVSSRNGDLQRRSRPDALSRKGLRRRARMDTWMADEGHRRRDRTSFQNGEERNPRKDRSKGKLQQRVHNLDPEDTSTLHETHVKRQRKQNVESQASDLAINRNNPASDSSPQSDHVENSPSSGVRAGHWCPPCDIRECPMVSPETCQGTIQKDWCDCCPVCNLDPDLDAMIQPQQPSPTIVATVPPPFSATESNACNEVTCGKHEVCMLNIQGIPMCRCPGAIYCKTGDRNPLCGEDGITYKSRCFLKAAKCETGKNILVAHKGRCPGSQEQRLQEREERRQEKQKRKAERQEIKQKKKSKEDRKTDKMRLREQKRQDKIRMREQKREDKQERKKWRRRRRRNDH